MISHCQKLFILMTALVCLASFQRAEAQKGTDVQVAQEGIYSLVEFNPADLMWGRYRLAHENLILDSVSFAWTGEVQEFRKKGDFQERYVSSGIALQWYPQSVTLMGLFVRGESDLGLMDVQDREQAKNTTDDGLLAVARVAGDIGWRVRMSPRLTGSASYGVRTTLPHTLWNNDEALSKKWAQTGEHVDMRVQINLGLLL